jgi:hypothetical protein
MNWIKLNRRFDHNNTRNFSCKTLSIVWLVIFFCCHFIIETAFADLSTIPPLVKSPQQQKQTQIKSIITKARLAIKENRLTKPVSNNAVYFVQQLFTLSPKDKRGFKILSEVRNSYTVLAYQKLGNNKISQAQTYHNKAKMIARQFNITFDSKPLAILQRNIIKRQKSLNRAQPVLTAQTRPIKTSTKIEKKAPKKPFTIPKRIFPQRKTQTSQQKPQKPLEKQEVITKPVLSPAEKNRIVVIVNKQNKVSTLTLRELKSLFKGHQKTWPNGEIVTLYLPPTGGDTQLWLGNNVFQNSSPAAVPQYYMGELIRNDLTKLPETSTNAVSDVSRITGGIAIVKVGEIDESNSVKIVPIDGI